MINTEDLTLAEFLSNKSMNEIHDFMLSELPEDMDKSQGQHVYNLTRPTALIVSELCQQTLPEIIRLIFPMWAYGEWLDYHASVRGITRRPATASSGNLVLTVTPGTEIPVGAEFSTASIDGQPAIMFRVTEAKHADTSTVTVPVECTQTGPVGNVAARSIVFKVTKLDGVKTVENPEDITGGTEMESDESLRERILEVDRAKSISYVGSVADYKRWSKEVAGVGEATVIPARDDSGLVTVVITDSNGDPANEALCKAVYDHIMSPDDPELRLTPPNARLLVAPPETLTLSISATVELLPAYSLESVSEKFLTAAQAYLATARTDQEIRFTQIGRILAGTEGVYDYDFLTINDGTENIPITTVQLPQVGRESVELRRGVVN